MRKILPQVLFLFIFAVKQNSAKVVKCLEEEACVVNALCTNETINTQGIGLISSRFGDFCDTSNDLRCCLRPIETEDDKETSPAEQWVTCKENQDCVQYEHCENGKVITDGSGLLLSRFSVECDTRNKTCCQKPEKFRDNLNSHEKFWKSCGDSAEISPKEQMPWNVAIFTKNQDRSSSKFVCAGSLIHPRIVIAAAHCVHQKSINSIVVRAGKSSSALSMQEDRDVKMIVVHENFTANNLFNDIAILLLSDDFSLDFIGTVCVPSQNKSFYGERCFVSVNDQKQSGALNWKVAEVPILSRKECKAKFRKTRVGPWFNLDRSFVCAGGEGEDNVCSGDGGGPLICKIAGLNNRYTLAGFVAWNVGCGLKDFPIAYVNIGHFRDWIDETMSNLDFLMILPSL